MDFMMFETYEDMVEELHRRERRLQENVLVDQRDITWGSYFIQLNVVEEICIFGHVPTERDFYLGELEAGSEPEELEYTRDAVRASYAKGYRMAECFSVMCPEGEWGTVHLATMWPIKKEDFERARRVGWDRKKLDPRFFIRLQREVAKAREVFAEQHPQTPPSLGPNEPHFEKVEDDGSEG